ncbi:MAG: M28 family peptidase [Bacteroidetes bacterium]|nr:M28 family peptidase [Bacteroidota bacterium]
MAIRIITLIALGLMLTRCGGNTIEPSTSKPIDSLNTEAELPLKTSPNFNADSAMVFLTAQIAIGPRVPNTPAHKACGDYLIKELRKYTEAVVIQDANVVAYTGKGLKIRNIMAQINPNRTDRIMLFAHWDSRPFADRGNPGKGEPVLGADDGASGVAVILEIARAIHRDTSGGPAPGIDIVFFDAEDYGDAGGDPETYCLGSQHWAKNRPLPIAARYGILLDMVGAKDAVFYQEGASVSFAPHVVHKVWTTAHKLGYTQYFKMAQLNGPITDDHYFINTLAKIPSIDIINYDPTRPMGFPGHWHTENDNLENIDPATLKAVGQTILQVLYEEPVLGRDLNP